MADLNLDTLSFEGTSPQECEAFVSMIRRQALDQGKHRDSEWMAVFASSYFVGDAFYWYEGLEEDVQNDWSQLRPALVAKFGRGGIPPTSGLSAATTSALTPSTTIPTPAAAPPIAGPTPSVRQVRTGCLKILERDGSLRGYIARSSDGLGIYDSLSTSPGGALSVTFDVSSTGKSFEIKIIDVFQLVPGNNELGIVWCNLPGNKWMDRPRYVAKCCLLSNVKSKNWAMERNVWQVSNNGELGVEYPKAGGGTERLQCSVQRKSARIAWLRPSRPQTSKYVPVRLVFEDAV